MGPDFCFVCNDPVLPIFTEEDQTAAPKNDGNSPLNFFCVFMKIPVETHLTNTACCKFCELCGCKIKNAKTIYGQIRSLEAAADEIRTDLKKRLMSSFSNSRNYHQNTNADEDLLVLRKCLFQCFSKCTVPLSRIPKDTLGTLKRKSDESSADMVTRNSKVRRHSKVTEETEEDSSVSIVNEDCSDTADEDCSSSTDSEVSDAAYSDFEPESSEFQKKIDYKLKSCHSQDTPPKKYSCPDCPKAFCHRRTLTEHIQSTHDPEFLSKCKHCEVNLTLFRRPNSDDGRIPEYPYYCNIENCKQVYKTVVHLRTHHQAKCPENPHKKNPKDSSQQDRATCEYCGNSYAKASRLRYHIASVHQKSFKVCCDICGQGFQTQSQLRDHAPVHSEEKPFQCETCGQRFKRSNLLLYHRRNHTGERPYVCEVCGKGFVKPGALKIHRENIHEDAQYPCELCGKSFKSLHYLRNHLKTTHQGWRRPRDRRSNQKSAAKGKSTGPSTSLAQNERDWVYSAPLPSLSSYP